MWDKPTLLVEGESMHIILTILLTLVPFIAHTYGPLNSPELTQKPYATENIISLFSDIYIANIEVIPGAVYRIISSQQFGEVCEIYLEHDVHDRAYNYPEVISRIPNTLEIIIFLPNSEKPLLYQELWTEKYNCVAYDNLNR